jgi:hypothetical protein
VSGVGPQIGRQSLRGWARHQAGDDFHLSQAGRTRVEGSGEPAEHRDPVGFAGRWAVGGVQGGEPVV